MASSSEATNGRHGFGAVQELKTDTRKVGTFDDNRGHWWQGDSAISQCEPTVRPQPPAADKKNPIVYMDFRADADFIGRVVIELQADFVPNSGMLLNCAVETRGVVSCAPLNRQEAPVLYERFLLSPTSLVLPYLIDCS
jgi:hypothetical protein